MRLILTSKRNIRNIASVHIPDFNFTCPCFLSNLPRRAVNLPISGIFGDQFGNMTVAANLKDKALGKLLQFVLKDQN